MSVRRNMEARTVQRSVFSKIIMVVLYLAVNVGYSPFVGGKLFADKNERQSRKPLESIPLLPKERISRALVGDIGIEIRVLDGNDPRPHRPVVGAQDRKVHAFDVDIHEIELRGAVFFHNTF